VTYDFLSALDLIGEAGPAARSFVPRLQQYLQLETPLIRFGAAWALWRVAREESDTAASALQQLVGVEGYPLDIIGPDEWGKALSDLKRQRESFHLRMAALGALWQMHEEARPFCEMAMTDLLRDWLFFTSMTGVIPEEQAAVPALQAILNNPAYADIHLQAQSAFRLICGAAGERW